jgi:hypothetical protein
MALVFVTKDRPRGRRHRIIAFAPFALAIVACACFHWEARRRLDRAIAEADRLDPGWRLAELAARRRAIPDGENAAGRVLAVAALLPKDWPESNDHLSFAPSEEPAGVEEAEKAPDPAGGTGEAPGDAPAEQKSERPPRGSILVKELIEVPPDRLLTERQVAGLRAELGPLQGAIVEARTLADLPGGRFDADLGRNAFGGELPAHLKKVQMVGTLLGLDARHRIQEGDIDGALGSCRALLGTARAIGDEPSIFAQLVRMGIEGKARHVLERALSRGDATDAALSALQAPFADEAAQDLALPALRGDRALLFDVFSHFASGELPPITKAIGMGAYVRYNQAILLRLQTRSVEAAKSPLHEQGPRWNAYDDAVREVSGRFPQGYIGRMAISDVPPVSSFVELHFASRAELRAAGVLLALERYRLAHGRRPETLEALVPEYLPAIPRDPYVDAPLRYKRLDDGVVVYGVGFDLHDNGGRLHPDRRSEAGYESGARLWDPAGRREAAADGPRDGTTTGR